MGAIKVKAGVYPFRLCVIIAAVANVAKDLPHDVVITSANDGKHMKGSKHYSYEALDIRTKNFPSAAAKRTFAEAVGKRLGASYQLILESEGLTNEHLHIEYDGD